MDHLSTAKLAGVIMTISIVVIAGTNLAYAEQPCGEQAYVYNVGCLPLDQAHIVGGVIVASLVIFAIAWGVAERHYHMVPNLK